MRVFAGVVAVLTWMGIVAHGYSGFPAPLPSVVDQPLSVQMALRYKVLIKNNATGRTFSWNARAYSDRVTCEQAIAGIQAQLVVVATGDLNAKIPEAPDSDDELQMSLFDLVMQIVKNTGKFPDLTISCGIPGDPA